jgi:16S rRNA processing protein RimM
LNEVYPENLLLLGKVIRPHGLAGILKIWSYAQSKESFLKAGRVYIKSVKGGYREFTVISVKPHKKTFLLELEEMTSLDEAEGCKGADICITKDTLSHDREDEYFWFELIGMRVFSDQGHDLGIIEEILATTAHDLYVARKGEKEILIPAIHEVVEDIDLGNRKMIISPMGGLLDLNEI